VRRKYVFFVKFDSKINLLHNLSPKKVEKALRYMDAAGLELKDFWLHSNLEEQDEAK
jgi:hypothetical protein